MLSRRIDVCKAAMLLTESVDLASLPEFWDALATLKKEFGLLPPALKLKCNFAHYKLGIAKLATYSSTDPNLKESVSNVLESFLPGIVNGEWSNENLSNGALMDEVFLKIDEIFDKSDSLAIGFSGDELDVQTQMLEGKLKALDQCLQET